MDGSSWDVGPSRAIDARVVCPLHGVMYRGPRYAPMRYVGLRNGDGRHYARVIIHYVD